MATLDSFGHFAPPRETARDLPRLLVLAPRYPYPIIGGDRLRIHHVCEQLAERYRLTLLCLCDRADRDSPAPPDGIFESVERIVLPRWQSRLNCLLALPTRVPLQLAYYWSKAFERRVAELAPQHDAILCHLIRLAEYALPFDMPRVLEMTDAISLNYRRVKEIAPRTRLRSLIYGIEQSRLETFEREIVDRFDAAVLVSHVDRQFLFSDDPSRERKVMVCSNGVDPYELPYQFSAQSSDRIVFIGNTTTLQNFDGVEWFAREVLPRIRVRRPQAVLEIIGHCGAAERERLGALEAVRVVGRVESMADAAAGGAVGVCPIRVGAGVQNKLLDYMALGLPSVTTPVGLEGVTARPGVEVLLAESANAMADAVVKLLTDRHRARVLAEAARDFVERHHRWPAQLEPLVERLGQLLGADTAASRGKKLYAAAPLGARTDHATRTH
ncbi:MAG TPA: glycosyltransferase family 4 protein [Gammaproteobacteria bacterium]|nr:glycosyltransferase family 4 protein [Gammaproteobacteria bacterium]